MPTKLKRRSHVPASRTRYEVEAGRKLLLSKVIQHRRPSIVSSPLERAETLLHHGGSMRPLRLLLAVLVALSPFVLLGAPSPYSVATLVQERDEAVLAEALREAVASPDALVRATAARVIAVRGLTQLLPLLHERVTAEADATAAREQIRALALVGGDDDLAAATSAASRFPAGMDDALALAVARRGGRAAVELYISTLRSTRMRNHAELFRVALWGHPDLIPFMGARVLGAGDEPGWRGLLDALLQSNVAMHGPMLVSSLGTASEGIRAASVWYVIRGYAMDPSTIPAMVREALAEPRTELSSDREDFGRELLRRMLGGEKKDDPRWEKFLEGDEADRLFADEAGALQYLTDREYAARYARGSEP